MPKLSFKPKQVTKKILSPLSPRAHEVIFYRYGLGDDAERRTLESIGQKYNITRERVRQIENAALATLRKSDVYKEHEYVFTELHDYMKELGSVIAEEDLLNHASPDENTQNHINFYLVLGDAFTKHKEDEHFRARWSVDSDIADEVHDALKRMYTKLTDDELVPEGKFIEDFLGELKNVNGELLNEEIARRWLNISKRMGKNPFNEWGQSDSSNVKVRGVRDYAYLVMRKHGSPLHFREIADSITKLFNRKTHVATTHNEVIKDKRFVLVGRGTYGLADWGYRKGVVRDVIKSILKESGPLSKDDIVDRVLKERFLKRNTILVNLQNPKYFKKMKNGLYTIA